MALVCDDPCTHSRDDIFFFYADKKIKSRTMSKTKEEKKSDYFCKSSTRIAPDSIMNNWLATMMDVMKQHCGGMSDQGMEMGMY